MDEKKFKVSTFEGTVEYAFINDEEEEEEVIVSPKKEKKPKKPKKKKKPKKPKKRSFAFTQLGIIVGLCGLIVYFLLFPTTVKPIHPLSPLSQRGGPTFAVSPFDSAQHTPYPNLPRLLEAHLRNSGRFHVLCMHHLKLGESQYYQACSVKSETSIYYMINPRILKLSKQEISVEEDSIVFGTRQTKRSECVLAEWSDHLFNLTGRFCGPPAISFQLAVEEFQ